MLNPWARPLNFRYIDCQIDRAAASQKRGARAGCWEAAGRMMDGPWDKPRPDDGQHVGSFTWSVVIVGTVAFWVMLFVWLI